MSSYYRDMAKVFFDATCTIDMSELYAPFLKPLPQHATILDAGCGSGRDALAFFRQGYQVQAFDACPELVQLARGHTGLDIQCASFADFQPKTTTINGIWACASLLHLPFAQLPETFRRLAQFLSPGGVIYCSFKYGDGGCVTVLKTE